MASNSHERLKAEIYGKERDNRRISNKNRYLYSRRVKGDGHVLTSAEDVNEAHMINARLYKNQVLVQAYLQLSLWKQAE